MKTYSKQNFFKHTYCEFLAVDTKVFTDNRAHFKSKSDSQYYYTKEGVYRYSNHWGRVANCRWKLISNKACKSQDYHVGYAKWTDFYPINSNEKQFYITVDFQLKKVNFQHRDISSEGTVFLFTPVEAQKRVKQIRLLLTETKWAKYFTQDINDLREQLINEFCNSNVSLQDLKRKYL